MLDILKFTIPSLILLACVWIVMHQMFKSEADKRQWEMKKQSQKEISQMRLRAYERLSILLERTQPEHLLAEMNLNGMSVLDVQQHLLRTIRMEYDHNLSQQVYISDELWDKILLARDEMGAFINSIAIQLAPGSSALDYAKALLTAYASNGETPNELALMMLKNEVRQLL